MRVPLDGSPWRPDREIVDAFADAQVLSVDAPPHAVVGLSSSLDLDRPVGTVRRATLFATAHGVYEATINDQPVSDAVLSPGWTSYEWRLQVQRYDVTDLLADQNTIAVRLGGGWYRGELGFMDLRLNYGERTAFLGSLVIEYRDGSHRSARQVFTTSPQWTGHTTDSPAASLYDGQTIDARLRGRPPRALPVQVADLDRSTLIAQVGPRVVRHESLRPVAITRSPSGATICDFGQNLVGWTRCRVQGPAGTTIVLRHAEVLDAGEVAMRPLRGAKATDTFICSGGTGPDLFEPTFTFHGFRYVEVSGWPGELTVDDIEAVVVHSEMARTGWFSCSDPRVEQLVANSVWSQRGNFLDIPTDCPQRDERMGWTGDIAVYAPTALVQFDCADLLHKWLGDLAAEVAHQPRRVVPTIVPDVLKHAWPHWSMAGTDDHARAVWGDAAVWVPEALWWATGDLDRLGMHYPTMVAHLESVEADLSPTGLWEGDHEQFGDWLDPDAPPDDPGAAKADVGVVATACLYRSARFTAEAAGLLGLDDDARRWRELAGRTRTAFGTHLVDDDGRIRSDCTTVYALAIAFGLLDHDADLRGRAGDRLDELVRASGHRISTGFAGTPYITGALSSTGHVPTAYRLLLETSCPSWLYPVTMGATTIWERWDSMLPDGSINPGEMTSFNHYALGAVVDWLFTVVAGINPAEPGYARIGLRPLPGPGLEWAHGTLDTPRGRVECGWRRERSSIVIETTVPAGITADVVLPDERAFTITGGHHRFTVATTIEP